MGNSVGKNAGIWVPEEFVCHAIPAVSGDAAQNGIPGNDRQPDTSNDVVFVDAYYRLFDRNSFAIPAKYQGREIRCVVSSETLVKRFGAKGPALKHAEAAFLSNKEMIQDLCKSAIQDGKVAVESEIIIE